MTRATLCVSSFLLLIAVSINISAQETADYLISWDPNPEPDISEYVLFRSEFPEAVSFVAIDSVDGNTYSYVDQGLEKGIRYYYRIKAKNTVGQISGFSNLVSAMTIPDDAPQALQDSCKITAISQSGSNVYDLNWETAVPTNGFIQYDMDIVLDLMSNWDTSEYSLLHTAQLQGLESYKYYARAIAFDEYDNLTISSLDSFIVENEDPAPLTTPQVYIYPVPYHPALGSLRMDNLPLGGTIQLFNSNGLEIYSETIGSQTSLNWDGSNINGSKVMSGVYYVMVKDKTGHIVVNRPIMVVN